MSPEKRRSSRSHALKVLLSLLLLSILQNSPCYSQSEPGTQIDETRYLLMQVFVPGVSNDAFPPQGTLEQFAQDIVSRIGATGDTRKKLGFCVGMVSFNQSDDEVRRLIDNSFTIARKNNVAVAFHVDDQMFWEKRSDLLNNKANIEWTDWNGTECRGRRLDWGPKPLRIAPQMCLNSLAIKKAVRERAHLIGIEIKDQIDKLKIEGRQELFAGVFAGSESQFGHDFASNRSTGFHALSNAGYDRKVTTAKSDAELSKILKEFIELWSTNLAGAGIPPEKIYCHLAFTDQCLDTSKSASFAQKIGFAVPSLLAFSKFYRPGFSTYPSETALAQITSEVKKGANPHWASAEGTNVVPNGVPGESCMESYLARLFNHGAIMVNIYSWGIGGEAYKNNFFRRATENEEAISAYRKFLKGAPLKEQESKSKQFSPGRLQAKMHKINTEIPLWVQRTHKPELVQGLMTRIDTLLKAAKFEDAEIAADELLKLVETEN